MKTYLRRSIFILIISAICTFTNTSVKAGTPSFENLNSEDINAILKDFASAHVPQMVTTARAPRFFGLELGLLAGVSKAPQVNEVSNESFDSIPTLAVMGVIHLPYGFGFEGAVLPVQVGDLKYNYYTAGVKMSIKEETSFFPDFKLKVQYTNAEILWKQDVNDTQVDVKYGNLSLNYSLTISKSLMLIEPYFGIARISSRNYLSSEGDEDIFGASVVDADRNDVEFSDTYIFYGMQINLFWLKLGFEAAKIYDNQKYTGKLSLAF